MVAISNEKDCTGCHACVNVCPQHCIEMENNQDGFWYPTIDENKCIKCKLCIKVCPVINKTTVQNKPKAYACMNKDESIRLKSSSGGMFTLIAENIIDNGGVVFGAGFDKDFSVIHSFTETKDELTNYRGSKYVQSKIGDTYRQAKEFLKQGRQVLFTGTPCQIGGLKSFLQQDYDNLFLADIICHGVPSPKVWQKYICYREDCASSQTQRIAFRNKKEGWRLYSVSFSFKNGAEHIQNRNKDLYMKSFQRDICLRLSCYKCNFKTLYRQSDITLADFWGIQNLLPDMYDNKGTSLIFVNSHKGKKIFEDIKEWISYKEVDINKAVYYNSSAIKSAERNPKREKFLKDLDKKTFDNLIKKYCKDKYSVKVKRKLKSVIRIILIRVNLLETTKKFFKRQ